MIIPVFDWLSSFGIRAGDRIMTDGVTTRLQKEVTQLQKDIEKLEVRIEAKLEKMGERMSEKLQQDLHTGIQQGLASLSADLSNMIRQLLPQSEVSHPGQKGSEVCNPVSQGSLQKSTMASSGLEAYKANTSNTPLIPESDSMNSIMDPLKTLSRRSKLECPRFEGYDFLGWLMKVEQFFEAVGTQEVDKVQIVMIHLDGKGLQWHQRYMKTKGLLKDITWFEYIIDMRARFHDTEFHDPTTELVSLKPTQSVISVTFLRDKFVNFV